MHDSQGCIIASPVLSSKNEQKVTSGGAGIEVVLQCLILK